MKIKGDRQQISPTFSKTYRFFRSRSQLTSRSLLTLTAEGGHRQAPPFQGGEPVTPKWICFNSFFVTWCLIASKPLLAQISSDGTVNTEVNTTDNITEIIGGETRGSNLFHSFQDFSIATGNTALFNNSAGIENIISRVTGGSISNIDGLIRANGNANLILINPRGINFGANARLDIGGSFLGSTADSISFADGNIFNAQDVLGNPLLTIAAPVGLQLGQSSGTINITGQGHDLSVPDPLFSPVIRGENRGLSVQPGETIALVGGDLVFDGGTVTAPGGRIELGSVATGEVRLNNVEQGWDLGYEEITTFQDIQLRSQALADVSGTPLIPGGSIKVRGQQLSVDGGSLLLIQNLAAQTAGTIEVDTSESVNVRGTDPSGNIRSRLTNETVGAGDGGDVRVKTNKVIVEGGAAIAAQTFLPGTGKGGDVIIDAGSLVRVQGSDTVFPSVTSSIATASFGVGDSGNTTISTKTLETLAGGTVLSTTLGVGKGGDVSITAEDIIAVGLEPTVFAPSGLSATTLNAGSGGNLKIDTSTLTVIEGARIDSAAAATGNAGSVTIDASRSVNVAGGVSESVNPSIITSSANILDPTLQELLRLPDTPAGNSGNLTINTPQLQVTDGALVTVRNDGTGNAGTLRIDANSVKLDRQGTISADTRSGQGGNILVNANNFVLQGQGVTTATAGGNGNGGNLTINTDNIVALDAARLTANAELGTGGNISINTQGLFICQDCETTASSRLGLDGVVNINTIEPNTSLEILDIPQQLTKDQMAIAIGCPAQTPNNLSTLSVTGRGGLPLRPQEFLNPESTVAFDLNPAQVKKSANSQLKNDSKLPLPARNWYTNPQGTVVLTAQAGKVNSSNAISHTHSCRPR